MNVCPSKIERLDFSAVRFKKSYNWQNDVGTPSVLFLLRKTKVSLLRFIHATPLNSAVSDVLAHAAFAKKTVICKVLMVFLRN